MEHHKPIRYLSLILLLLYSILFSLIGQSSSDRFIFDECLGDGLLSIVVGDECIVVCLKLEREMRSTAFRHTLCGVVGPSGHLFSAIGMALIDEIDPGIHEILSDSSPSRARFSIVDRRPQKDVLGHGPEEKVIVGPVRYTSVSLSAWTGLREQVRPGGGPLPTSGVVQCMLSKLVSSRSLEDNVPNRGSCSFELVLFPKVAIVRVSSCELRPEWAAYCRVIRPSLENRPENMTMVSGCQVIFDDDGSLHPCSCHSFVVQIMRCEGGSLIELRGRQNRRK